MMKRFTTLLIVLFWFNHTFSQTSPAAQTLPLLINFGSANFTPPASGMVAWTGDGTRPYATQAAAENSLPGADVAAGALFNTNPASGGGGGQYGHAVSANGRLTILQSGNGTNGSTQTALAINTTGLGAVTIGYDLVLSVANTRDIGISLQYRVGTTGAFTAITGSNVIYNSGTSNGGDADGPNDFDAYSFSLPAGALNQPVVQIRWVTWRPAGSGNACGIGIDNISIGSNSGPCTAPANQPTSLVLTPSTTTMQVSFTASVPAADGYLVVRSQSASLGATPVNGTTYTVGQALGSGTVAQNGTATSFTDNGLAANTLYYYFVFAYNSISCTGGPTFQTVNPLTGSSTTQPFPPCITPADPPSGLVLVPGGTTITGSFTPELSANRYLVVYSQNTTLSFVPSDGTTYTPGQVIGPDKIAAYGSSTAFVITGLNGNTTYHVFVFSANGDCTGEPFYNTSSLNGSTTTLNGGPPAGYYDAVNGLTCQTLKTGLRNIISNGQVSLSYGSIDDIQMPIVDTIRSDDGLSSIIWDIYSNNPVGPEPFTFNSSQNPSGGFCGGSTPGTEGGCWNKEHTFPRSWFKLSGSSYQQPTEADLFVVRPTDSKINSNRGNIPYSTVGSSSYQFPTAGAYPGYPMPPNPVLDKIGPSNYPGVSAASSFEPHDGVKGDLARAYFYILTRYQNELANWVSLNGAAGLSVVADGTTGGGLYPSFQLSYLQMLYAWHNLDPVDTKESNRNDLIYSQQNNRNPYIDHPEYVALVWQCTGVLPVTVTDFTAQRNNESVLLKWYATYETNFRQYAIERSIDGSLFHTIGYVQGQNLANYSFTDNNLPNENVVYYRLKMIDVDGKFTYSKIASVRLNGCFYNALIYPNPAKTNLTIKLQNALAESSDLAVMDASGRILLREKISAGRTTLFLNVGHLPAGRYFIKISSHTELIRQSFVIIQ